MDWFTGKPVDDGDRQHPPPRAATTKSASTKYGSPMKHIPSFNDFLGDQPGMELETENRLQEQQKEARAQEGISGMGNSSMVPPAAVPRIAGNKPSDKNPWRSVFDPGHNPNMHRVGRQYYDTVNNQMGEPTVWEYIVQAEQLSKGSFEAMDRGGKGYLEREDLAAAFDSKYGDAGRLVEQADVNRDGRIDKGEFQMMVDDLTSQGGVAWTE